MGPVVLSRSTLFVEPHRRHCVVVLEQDTFYPSLALVQPRMTRPCLTEILLMGGKESNQTNKTNLLFLSEWLLNNQQTTQVNDSRFDWRFYG